MTFQQLTSAACIIAPLIKVNWIFSWLFLTVISATKTLMKNAVTVQQDWTAAIIARYAINLIVSFMAEPSVGVGAQPDRSIVGACAWNARTHIVTANGTQSSGIG